MRRADRLFQIIQILRAGRKNSAGRNSSPVITAAKLASELEVSERTIYRDIADLQANRVPIEGEAGVGYMLRDGYDLPPLMFTRQELDALLIGARLLTGFGGRQMAAGIAGAIGKIEEILPDDLKGKPANLSVYAFQPVSDEQTGGLLDICDRAVSSRTVLKVDYRTGEGVTSVREIEPLGLIYWGKVWTLVAWCRLRDDFRSFRVDRMKHAVPGEETFELSAEKSMQAWLMREAEAECREIPDNLLEQFK